MRDAPARTSFLQSLAEIDHRDRFHHHANHKHHEYLHRRQVDAALDIDATVTSVTSTVSVIQDIEIDSNGNTVAIQTWLAASTTVEAPTDPTVAAPTTVLLTSSAPAAAPSTTMILNLLNTEMISQLSSTQPTLPTLPIQTSQALPLTSGPFLSTNSSSEYQFTVLNVPPLSAFSIHGFIKLVRLVLFIILVQPL
jgi:hypothetical protein